MGLGYAKLNGPAYDAAVLPDSNRRCLLSRRGAGVLSMWKTLSTIAASGLFVISLVAPARADDTHAAKQTKPADAPMSLAERSDPSDKGGSTTAAAPGAGLSESAREEYREVSDFFNVREANPSVVKGEWEVEWETLWFTRKNQKDEVDLVQSVKYGFTEDFFMELEVLEPNLGQGANQGAGTIEIIAFNRFLREKDNCPAVSGYVELRLPTGDGTSKVDAAFNAIVTKSITEKLRVNFQGFLESANGRQNAGDENRRSFQWGLGPGVDYLFDDKTLGLINYVNRSSNQYGNHNINLLELGVIREVQRNDKTNQHVKFALDIGLDGAGETPNLGAKFQWSLDWK